MGWDGERGKRGQKNGEMTSGQKITRGRHALLIIFSCGGAEWLDDDRAGK